jgi:hypothetical protein
MGDLAQTTVLVERRAADLGLEPLADLIEIRENTGKTFQAYGLLRSSPLLLLSTNRRSACGKDCNLPIK